MMIFIAEARLFFKNRTGLLLCASYLVLSLLAVFLGADRSSKEVDRIKQLEDHYQVDVQNWKKTVDTKGVGYAAYYLFNPAILTPSPWSFLFTGDREERLVIQRVRLLSVHGQIHGNPIVNSNHSILGHLDIEFIWLYLMPLLIGLISVTCVSNELRLKRWSLLRSLTSENTLITTRLGVRFGIVLFINLLVLITAIIALPIPIDLSLIKILMLLVLYQMFWFTCSAIIVLYYFNVYRSILSFVFFWLLSVWLIPSIYYANSLDSKTYNTGIELLIKQRQDMNDSWDRNKKKDFENFLKEHPKWKNTQKLKDGFDWRWYFAMQKASDNKINNLTEKYFASRIHTGSVWMWFSPTLVIQKSLEDISHTGAQDYQNYLKSIIKWHGDTQDHWFSYLFLNKIFTPKDLDFIPKFRYKDETNIFFEVMYQILLITLGSLLILSLSRKRN